MLRLLSYLFLAILIFFSKSSFSVQSEWSNGAESQVRIISPFDFNNNQNEIFSTVHFPGNSGADGVGSSVTVPDASDNFHIYELDWSPDRLLFSVDGNVHFQFTNSQTVPFNKDFFIILNVAMGGNFGGTIDPNFVESTMEVDYVRVYK